MELIIQTFWFFLPAGVANIAPVLFKWLPFLDCPVDLGKEISGTPIFGKNKTYRGFLVGILCAVGVVYIQKFLYVEMQEYSTLDYQKVNPWIVGGLLGFGALLGDLVKSFFKRRLRIPPGEVWAPFDQTDWIVGAIIAASFIVDLDYKIVLTAIILGGILHPVVNLLGFYFKIKKNVF